MEEPLSQKDLPSELRFTNQPTLDFRFFVLAILDNYESGGKSLRYGFLLYDYLDRLNQISIEPAVKKEFFAKANNDINNAKSLIIDWLFESGTLEFKELRNFIKTNPIKT